MLLLKLLKLPKIILFRPRRSHPIHMDRHELSGARFSVVLLSATIIRAPADLHRGRRIHLDLLLNRLGWDQGWDQTNFWRLKTMGKFRETNKRRQRD